MTPEIQKFIELLGSQVGYSEKSGSYTKFGKWYGNHVEFDADYSSAPWCDMYLSWAAHKLGYQDWIGQFAWTVRHAEWFKEQGAWGKTPKVGAFVFYDWSGTNKIDNIDHVGIVTKVEHGRIFTIEGNIDGGVAKRKERDTSKVVGYGYPERIKSRLDEAAAKKAEKQASTPGSEPGTLPEDALNSLIPRSADGTQDPPTSTDRLESRTPTQQEGQVKGQTPEEAQGRTEPRTPEQSSKETQGRTQASKPQSDTASPQPSASASDSNAASSSARTPQAGASPTAKTGKHAKPTTADTEEATAKPLPVHTDASATGPLPAINSPTLIGSAVVAALALLAVAKTRRLRLSAAATTADKPARRAKGRRRRTATAPITATSSRGTVELQESAERLATAAALRSLSASSAHHSTTARDPHHHAAAHHTGRHTTSRDTARHAAAREAARHSRHRRLETRPFDLASDAAPHRHTTTGAGTYTPAFDSYEYEPDFDRGRFAFTEETGPLEVVLDTGPLQRVVDTSPFERIVIPGASSAFDAFAPPRSRRGDILDVRDPGASYRGRRRGHTVEEPIAFSPDLPPRGRRHRRSNHDPLPHGTSPRGHRGQDDLVGAAQSGRGRHRA